MLFIFAITDGCKNSDNNNQEVFLGEILFGFSLQNSDGKDLLDSSVKGSFNTSSISLYEKVSGDYVLFRTPNSAYPNGYTIDLRDGKNYFNPFYFDNKAQSHDLKIDWGNGITDYIIVNCENGDGNWKVAKEITYNGELVWNRIINPEGLYFTVIVE